MSIARNGPQSAGQADSVPGDGAQQACTICTLFEGDYHFGLAALLNSLAACGFRGEVFAGYRGDLPGWADAASEASTDGISRLALACGLTVAFVRLRTDWHLTNYKPVFMKDVIARFARNAQALFYFDPDILVRAPWPFFSDWARYGIAACEDVCSPIPASHPRRLKWREMFPDLSLNDRHSPYYVNAGFLGVTRERLDFLDLWTTIIVRASKYTGGPDRWYTNSSGHHPGNPFSAFDQDALNVALMASSESFSLVGKEGMDFAPGGYIMAHAVGSRKPWRGGYARNALMRGLRPSMADREYVRHCAGPIEAVGGLGRRALAADLLIAKILGRLLT